MRPDGEPVVLEVNTLPGMTETSLLPKGGGSGRLRATRSCASGWWSSAIGQTGSVTPARKRKTRDSASVVPHRQQRPGQVMWFKRKPKNRRLGRAQVLDVKLRSSQVRAARTRLAAIASGLSFGTVFGLYLLWRAGEWALNRLVYENPVVRHPGDGRADRRRHLRRTSCGAGAG